MSFDHVLCHIKVLYSVYYMYLCVLYCFLLFFVCHSFRFCFIFVLFILGVHYIFYLVFCVTFPFLERFFILFCALTKF